MNTETAIAQTLNDAFDEKKFLTPPELSRFIRTETATIRDWCEKQILKAVDTRADGAKRPRWKIDREAWEAFKRRRAGLAPKKARRRNQKADLSEFFGDEFE